MAGITVRINKGTVEATDYADEVPREQWQILVSARKAFAHTHLPYDCRELLRFVDEARDMLEPLGYQDLDDFIRRGLELDPVDVGWALDGLRRWKPDEAAPFDQVVELGKHGGDRRSDRADQGCNATLKRDRAYILARLRRDGHVDLVERVEAGEVSAHRAALEVGYRRQPTALDRLRTAWARASEKERAAFIEEVTAP